MTTLTARLHPKWVGGRDGYHYSVICRGELIVLVWILRAMPLALCWLGASPESSPCLTARLAGHEPSSMSRRLPRVRVTEEDRDGLRFRPVDPADSSYGPVEAATVKMRAKG